MCTPRRGRVQWRQCPLVPLVVSGGHSPPSHTLHWHHEHPVSLLPPPPASQTSRGGSREHQTHPHRDLRACSCVCVFLGVCSGSLELLSSAPEARSRLRISPAVPTARRRRWAGRTQSWVAAKASSWKAKSTCNSITRISKLTLSLRNVQCARG